MIAWFYNLFVPQDLSFEIGEAEWLEIPPETRVRVDEDAVGTIAGLREGTDGKTRARVVFIDPVHSTWIEEVSLHRISLAAC
jgi:hypothetical protein